MLKEARNSHQRTIKEKTFIIDSMSRVSLPQEASANVLPAEQQSHLYTSLAVSDAWIDSIGNLRHTLSNKDSAILPVRKEITERAEESKEVNDTVINDQTKVNRAKDTTEVKEKIVEVAVERFCGKFFYYSGWLMWLVLIAGTVIYLEKQTKIKPITFILRLITKIIK